ncbi:hypothetical protein TNCV_1677941 [Trichonephila clavipes]|nr:hypothetical protein TNCV_1677941 [Trichonephila clavipes]
MRREEERVVDLALVFKKGGVRRGEESSERETWSEWSRNQAWRSEILSDERRDHEHRCHSLPVDRGSKLQGSVANSLQVAFLCDYPSSIGQVTRKNSELASRVPFPGTRVPEKSSDFCNFSILGNYVSFTGFPVNRTGLQLPMRSKSLQAAPPRARWVKGWKDGKKRRSTRGLLATDHVILNHGQVTWTTPELAPPSPNYHTTPREDVSALDRFKRTVKAIRALGHYLGGKSFHEDDEIKDEVEKCGSDNRRQPSMAVAYKSLCTDLTNVWIMGVIM